MNDKATIAYHRLLNVVPFGIEAETDRAARNYLRLAGEKNPTAARVAEIADAAADDYFDRQREAEYDAHAAMENDGWSS